MPEIPTTLPTVDELLGDGLGEDRILDVYLTAIGERSLEVLTIHAEVEGGPHAALFAELLERLRGRVRFRRLVDVAHELDVASLPVCAVIQGTRAGRAGTVSCQA